MLTTGIYALAHFAVDLGCAFAVFSAMDCGELGYLLYNFFAFAMQMPLGVLADRLGHGRWFAAVGCVLTAAVCCMPRFGLFGAILLGLGNGLFHVGGGVEVMSLSGSRAAPLGVFVSPGALGLFVGTLLGKADFPAWPVVTVLLVLAVTPVFLQHPTPIGEKAEKSMKHILLPAAALFLVVVLRSYTGMAGSFQWKAGPWAWVAVGAVVLGKAAGGFAADRFGARLSAFASLGIAAFLFLLSQLPLPGVLALFFFNITMPITLWALAQAMPAQKGFAFGLLTFALFLGFLPSYFGASSVPGSVLAAVSIVSGLLLTVLPWRKEAACG